MEGEILPRHYLEPLYKVFCLQESEVNLKGNLLNTYQYLTSSEGSRAVERDLLPENYNNKYVLEIVKNWRYCPHEKIGLEYGKLLKHEGRLDESLKVLKRITTKLNADWRSVYRAFHLISEIYLQQNKSIEANEYRELCLKCNHRYPVRG